jgi:hypothetical protein
VPYLVIFFTLLYTQFHLSLQFRPLVLSLLFPSPFTTIIRSNCDGAVVFCWFPTKVSGAICFFINYLKKDISPIWNVYSNYEMKKVKTSDTENKQRQQIK